MQTIPAGFQDWTQHMHDDNHTSVSAETILSASTSYRLHWSANTGFNKAYSSPAVVYNATLGISLVYVGDQGGDFDAFNAATGALVWQYKTVKIAGLSKEIEPSPAVSNNTVYFGDGDYHEYALNATTGALICKSVSVGGIISSSPVIGNPDGHGDVVYFGDAGVSGDAAVQDGGHMWAIYGVGNTDGAACATKWVFDAFGSPAGSQTGLAGVYSSPAYTTLSRAGSRWWSSAQRTTTTRSTSSTRTRAPSSGDFRRKQAPMPTWVRRRPRREPTPESVVYAGLE